MAKVVAQEAWKLIMFGQCVPSMKQNAVKVLVRRPELSQKYLWHFKEDHYFYAHDPNNECKTGDHVVIRQLEQKKSPIIQHEVVQLVYKCGNTVDPLTGKPCVASQYREDIDAIIDQFGRLSSTFEYKDAPPRGRFEQDRDITALPVYRKWHEDGIDDPYGVQVDPNPKLPKKEKLLYKNKIIK